MKDVKEEKNVKDRKEEKKEKELKDWKDGKGEKDAETSKASKPKKASSDGEQDEQDMLTRTKPISNVHLMRNAQWKKLEMDVKMQADANRATSAQGPTNNKNKTSTKLGASKEIVKGDDEQKHETGKHEHRQPKDQARTTNNADKFKSTLNKLEAETGGMFIFFGIHFTKPDDHVFTEDDILSTEHILIPKEVFDSMNEFFTKTSQMVLKLSLGGQGSSIRPTRHMWETCMIPKLKSTDVMIEQGQWKSAMCELMGMLWFITWYDTQQHPYTTDTAEWFVKYISSWSTLMREHDDELGLAISGGRGDGYYRQQLERQLDQLKAQYQG